MSACIRTRAPLIRHIARRSFVCVCVPIIVAMHSWFYLYMNAVIKIAEECAIARRCSSSLPLLLLMLMVMLMMSAMCSVDTRVRSPQMYEMECEMCALKLTAATPSVFARTLIS